MTYRCVPRSSALQMRWQARGRACGMSLLYNGQQSGSARVLARTATFVLPLRAKFFIVQNEVYRKRTSGRSAWILAYPRKPQNLVPPLLRATLRCTHMCHPTRLARACLFNMRLCTHNILACNVKVCGDLFLYPRS